MSESRGIDHFIAEGGFFMERLAQAPINSDVEVVVLAGNRPTIRGIMNEKSGPSDGILFVESALALPESTPFVAQEVMPLNHITITADRRAKEWLCGVMKSGERHTLSREELNEVRMQGLGMDMRPDEVLPASPLCGGAGMAHQSRKTREEVPGEVCDEQELFYEIGDIPEFDRDLVPELKNAEETALPLL